MKRKGFTLVEVLAVIAIITILGFGAITIAQSVIAKANVNKTETIMSTLNAVLEEYFRVNKSYPASGIHNLYETLNSDAEVRKLLEGLPQDCVVPLVYDWDGAGPANPVQRIVICDGWYASDDKSVGVNLADNDTVVDGNGVNEPMIYINRGQGNFPQIRSAGKDRTFGTADDIVSTEL
ncbi:MAG: type II secretion system protein [Sedimentisphaerales bacterium]|nr:type II secretion system protein [Sedimentisphaerales bacterium]MBN2842004.1 type II secretion system protein [Sedimentisphaerales bacterium]